MVWTRHNIYWPGKNHPARHSEREKKERQAEKRTGMTTSENGQASTSTNSNKRPAKVETDFAIIVRGASTSTDGYGIGEGQGQGQFITDVGLSDKNHRQIIHGTRTVKTCSRTCYIHMAH